MTARPPPGIGVQVTRRLEQLRRTAPTRAFGGTSDVTLADAARDRGDWAEAARLYRQVLARGRDRADLLVQLGHCLKEMGRQKEALEAYRGAHRIDPADPDPLLHLGHLLKVSGNPLAAQGVYAEAAALGSADAAAEMAACRAARFSNSATSPPGLVLDRARVAACSMAVAEVDADPASRLEEAAHALLATGDGTTTRACLDLAAILRGFGDSESRLRLRHLAAVASAQAWPATPDTQQPPKDSRSMLRALVRASIADGLPGAAAAGPTPMAGEQLAAAASEILFAEAESAPDPALAACLAALHEALARATTQPDGEPFPEALRAAVARVAESPLKTSYPLDVGTADDAILARTAWRVLHNLSRRIAADILPLLAPVDAGGLGPRMMGTLARGMGGGYPLYLLAYRPGPAFTAIDLDLLEDVVAALLPDDAAEAERTGHAGQAARALARGLDRGAVLPTAAAVAARGWTGAARLIVADLIHAGGVEGDRGTLLDAARTLKQAGAWQASARIMTALTARFPDDDDLLAELAIVQKTTGDFAGAAASLQRLLERRPDASFVERELLAVLPEVLPPDALTAWIGATSHRRALASERLLYRLDGRRDALPPGTPDRDLTVLPRGMLLEHRLATPPDLEERIEVLQVGWMRSADGHRPRLAGIEAIRLRVVSRVPIAALRLRLSGRTIAYVPAQPAARPPACPPGWHFTIFNAWIDVAAIDPGRHELQLYVEEVSSGYRTVEMEVEIGEGRPRGIEASDAVVLAPPAPGRSVEERVDAQPSEVRPARRGLAAAPPGIQRVLVVRADQLGDAVASIPAMRRLREMLPEARFRALATPATRDLLDGLGLFEEVEVVALAYDHITKRRHLASTEALRLRQRLAGWKPDLAVDLSPGTDTRPLLRLADAACTAGFKPREFPWLNFGMETISRDVVNGRECMSHTAMVSGFVEALGAALLGPARSAATPAGPQAAQITRYAVARGRVGLPPAGRLAVLHAGARLDFKRWPAEHFARLAVLATEALPDLHVLLVADTPLPSAVSTPLRATERIRLAEGHLPFADFEALLAGCDVFVGNDTGPKHLAAHLGAPVVSLHMGQVNWSEWGQEGEGAIVSRRVPCCGCGIEDLADCGKALACLVAIRPEEVLTAVLQQLARKAAADGAAA